MGDKNGCKYLVLSDSREGINKAIFEWHYYYGKLLNIEDKEEDTTEETSMRYGCYKNNIYVLATDIIDVKNPTVL